MPFSVEIANTNELVIIRLSDTLAAKRNVNISAAYSATAESVCCLQTPRAFKELQRAHSFDHRVTI